MMLARPEAAADARGDPERHLLAAAGRAPRPTAFAPADSEPDAGLSVEVRDHVLGHGRGHGQPRLQPGRERRLPGRGQPALPGLLLREAAVLHGRAWATSSWRAWAATRSCARPSTRGASWTRSGACKTTGTAGKRRASAMLAAGDEAPGRQLTGEAPNPFLGERKDFYIARGQYSLGRASYVGAIVTDTEFGSGPQPRRRRATCRCGWGKHAAQRHVPGHDAAGRRTARRARTGSAGQAHLRLRDQAVRVRHPGRALRPRLPDGHRVPEPGRHHAGLELRRAELLPGREEVRLVQAHRARSCSAQYGRDRIQGGNPWIVRARRAHALHAAGLLPRRHRLGRGAVGRPGRSAIRNVRIIAEAQVTALAVRLHAVRRSAASIFYDQVDPYLGKRAEPTSSS